MITYVTKRNGHKELVDYDKINNCVQKACLGLEDVAASEVVLGAKLNLYEGIPTKDIDKAMILGARGLIEIEPNYTYVAARLLLNTIYKEVFGISTNSESFDILYRAWFIESIENLVKDRILNPKLLSHFNLEVLSEALVPERDRLFKYMGLQTLLDRYLKRDRSGRLYQTPQMWHMVIAMGLSVNEDASRREAFALDLYEKMSTHRFSPSTPTLFNSGCVHSQLSSCFSPDTLIVTDNGLQEISKVSIGDKVLSQNGIYNSVINKRVKRNDQRMLEVCVRGIFSTETLFKVTEDHLISSIKKEDIGCIRRGFGADHPCAAKQGKHKKCFSLKQHFKKDCDKLNCNYSDKIQWNTVSSLNRGDYVEVLFPREEIKHTLLSSNYANYEYGIENGLLYKIRVDKKRKLEDKVNKQTTPVKQEISVNKDFMLFLGYYLAEGHCASDYISFTFNSKEIEYIQEVVDLSNKIFGVKACVNENKDGSTNVLIHSVLLATMFTKLFGTGFNIKKLPSFIMQSPKEYLEGLIIGVFRGDACSVKTGIILSLCNKTLCYQIFQILLKLGCLPILGKGHMGVLAKNQPYTVNLHKLLCEDIINKIGKDLDKIKLSKVKIIPNDRFFVEGRAFYRINKLINIEYNDIVIDLEVENDPSFAANMICAHNCYLSTMDDSVDGIMGEMHNQARLSKFAGGLGLDITGLRGAKSPIKGTNGQSGGVIPFAAVFDRLLVAFNQAGKRPGSGCLYLETWHIDIWDFLQLKKKTGDERRRTHDADTAVWINDLLMEYKKTDRDWYLFSPDECPNLHSLYGAEFKVEYEACVTRAKHGSIKNFKVISSKKLAKEMYRQYCETGHPFHCFKDSSNIRYANKHKGTVNSSNLCCIAGDQLIPTEKGFCYAKDLYLDGSNNKVVGRTKIEIAGPMLLPRPKADLLKITTFAGHTHKVTPDHPIWHKDKGWVEAKDLQVDDKICVQQIEGLWGKEDNKDLAFICGILAMQNRLPGKTRLELYKKDFDLLSIIKQKLAKFSVQIEEENIADKKVLLDPILSEKFDAILYKNNAICVPDFILRSNKETIIEYLKGIFLPHSIKFKPYRETLNVGIFNPSEEFLKTLQIILLNFPIYTNVKYEKKLGTYKLFSLHLSDGPGELLLDKLVGLSAYLKDPEYMKNSSVRQKTDAKIVKIEKLPPEDTYCLTVNSSEHSWVANGIVTKNTEIIEHTKPSLYDDMGRKVVLGETAVCTLNSLNLMTHINLDDFSLNLEKMRDTIKSQVRCLDNAIDNNFYPTLEAANSAKQNRQLGIGIMGFQEYLHTLGIAYSDPRAVELSGKIFEWISLCAIEESIELAKERGPYPNYPGSEWSKGKLPQDLYEEHYKYRFNKTPTYNTRFKDKWDKIREDLAVWGLRNGNLLAQAPTATISYILGASQSNEPDYSLLWAYETLSGKFTMINSVFVKEMKKRGLWCKELADSIKQTDGDIKLISGIPEDLKEVYCTAFDQDMFALIRCAAERNIWIDQAQSLNLYYAGKSLKHVDDIISYGHDMLIKTFYYMRSKGASKIEKSTQVKEEESCSIEAMKRGEICESCQ